MQKIILSITITLLAAIFLLVGIAYFSPGFVKEITNRVYLVPTEKTITLDDFENSNKGKYLPNGSSTVILGESSKSEPTQTLKPPQQNYQPPEPLPTAIPTQEPIIQQSQEQKTPWDGYANKEAFCKDIADRVMQQPLPQIDQSNLPPELRVSPNLDAMWKDAYQSCMNQIRNY